MCYNISRESVQNSIVLYDDDNDSLKLAAFTRSLFQRIARVYFRNFTDRRDCVAQSSDDQCDVENSSLAK